MRLVAITAITATMFGVVACSDDAQNEPDDTSVNLELLLDWKAEPTYAGFFLAESLGYFDEENISVDIIEGAGATTSTQLIGQGRYPIGSNSGAATAIAVSRGIPVRSIAVYYHDLPTVIYSRSDAPILEPADLDGKTMGLIDGSITKDEYRGLVRANGLEDLDITEVSAGFEVAPLLTGQVDGLMNYAELTPVQLSLDGHEIETMRLSDFGVHAYSLNLIVNSDFYEREPETVAGVKRALNRGYLFVRDNPSEAAHLFSELFPEKDAEFVELSMQIVARQLGTGEMGEQTEDGWQATLQTMADLELLDGDVTITDVMVD